MADKKPVEQSLIARAVQGVKYIITGNEPSGWMGPAQPIAPVAQDEPGAKGRQFDFPVGYNLQRNPKSEGGSSPESIGYNMLRAFADNYDLLRLVIETRKDQISKMDWSFVMKDKKATPSSKIDELIAFFKYPDRENDWDTWIRVLIEEMLVTDATSVYPRLTLGGDVYSMELIDGATIKRLIDNTGRTPLPPNPAYQQIIKGLPAVNYNSDELIFRPRNKRVHKFYGFSPVEQVIMTVNIAMRRQVYQLNYYTEGNVPEMLIGVPETWNPGQIAEFQGYWDELLEGNLKKRRQARFVPGGMNPIPTKESILKDGYDEWLARIICFAFNISPQSLVAMMNRATAETAQQQAMQEGLAPLQKWIKNLIDYIVVKYFGITDIEFQWEEEEDVSPEKQKDILVGYVQAKIITDDEAREALGRDPFTPEQREQLKPPPAPGMGDDPNAEDDEDKEGKPKDKDKEEEADETQVGKSVKDSGLEKGKRKSIDRERKAIKTAATKMEKLVQKALNQAAKRISTDLSDTLGKAKKDGDKVTNGVKMPELKAIEKQIAEYMKSIYIDGAEVAAIQIDVEFDKAQLKQVNKNAVAYSKARSAELVTELTESTREFLRPSITQAVEEGWSVATLKAAIMDNFAFSESRSEMIATTELAFADVQGNLKAYKESGVVDGKQWVLSQDDYCDDCLALDGVIVGLDESFPGDGGDGPPLHPRCRCDVIPVIND
jgi:SPP1 gp7 family putative phage head morphogenesis protein